MVTRIEHAQFGIGGTASSLRREIANFIASNPNLEIADTPLYDWVKWDSGTSVQTYASRMAVRCRCCYHVCCRYHVCSHGC